MYLEMYNKEDYVPLNWDKLITNPDVWETIKEEIEKKFSADCMMTVITAAKEAGLKDADIFLPVADMEDEMEDSEEEEVDMEEGMPEYASLEEDSIGDSTED
jgi:hypothetical protein